MQLRKVFKKTNGAMVFTSAVYQLDEHPGVELFKDPDKGWVLSKHMRPLENYRWGMELLPEWLHRFIDQDGQIFKTRGELLAALEAAKDREAKQGSLSQALAD